MNINSEKLSAMAKEAGVSDEQLVKAVVRPGLAEADAFTAVANWKSGCDHPRAKAEDIRSLARAIGCEPRSIARFVSISRFVRSGPRKSKLVVDMIRGKRIDEAINLLVFNKRRAAMLALKPLKAAIADAESADADVARLYVTEARVDSGPTIKRFQPKDRGRAHPIKKRTSHIVIGVEEAS